MKSYTVIQYKPIDFKSLSPKDKKEYIEILKIYLPYILATKGDEQRTTMESLEGIEKEKRNPLLSNFLN